MQKEKHTCQGELGINNSNTIISKMISGGSYDKCGLNAKYFEDGEWYCGTHAPSKIHERLMKKFAKWNQEKLNKPNHE